MSSPDKSSQSFTFTGPTLDKCTVILALFIVWFIKHVI